MFQALDLKYQPLSLAYCRDITHFYEQLKAYRNGLHVLSNECKISELHFVDKYNTSLGPRYDAFSRNLYQDHKLIFETSADGTTAKAIAFEKAVIAVEREEQTQKNNQQVTALIAHQVQKHKPSRFCSKRVTSGHRSKTQYITMAQNQ